MAKAAYNIALFGLACITEAEAKFTVVDKQKDSQSLEQVSKVTNAPIGLPVKLHLDHVYSVTAHNNLLLSNSDTIPQNAKQEQKGQNMAECGPTCNTCGGAADADEEEAEEIEKSEKNMKKMLERKEEKDTEREMVKETKKKVEKANKEMTDENDKKEIKDNNKQKLAKIKKRGKAVEKKVEKQAKKEDERDAKKKIEKKAEDADKEAKEVEKGEKVKKILDEGEKKADKKKKEADEKVKESDKKVEAAAEAVKAEAPAAPAAATAPATATAPASEPKVEKAEPAAITITAPSKKKAAEVTIQKVSDTDEDKDGEQIEKEEKAKEQDEKATLDSKVKTEIVKEESETGASKKEEKKKTAEKKAKKALKKDLKKDPYKQSVDILNGEPFVNIRGGGDRGSPKGLTGASTDDGDKKYTQKQFDVAVRMAAHDSAQTAVDKLKEAQQEDKADQHELKKEIKKAEKGKKALTAPGTKQVKSAIKQAVIKVSGNAKIAEPSLSTEFDKEAHKHAGPLYHAIQGIVDDPYANGLNAATTAGIAVAKQVLDGSSGAMDNSMKGLSMSSRGMPPGITAAGFLDDEEFDD